MAASLLMGSLTLTGGLLSVTPAYAAEDTLQVITPAQDESLESRTVEVTGTGTPGGLIDVATGASQPTPLQVEVDADGAWETTFSYPEDYPATPSIAVTQTVEGEPAGRVERSFKILDPNLMFVDSPVDGATVESRAPAFTGRAPAFTNISASIEGVLVGATVADQSGAFLLTISPDPGPGGPVEVLIEGIITQDVYEGVPLQPTTRSIVLPASLPAPVVTAPVNTTVTGTTISISGTAAVGRKVRVQLVTPQDETGGFVRDGIANGDGDWSVAIDLPAGDYTGFAYIPGSDPEGYGSESYLARLEFSVQALAAAVSPAGQAPLAPVSRGGSAVKVAPSPQLAATGASADLLAGGAGAMLALGAALVLIRSRRTRQTRTRSTQV